ncbi:MAG: ribulose-phosphate 3-epimerase [Nitrospinae bacterium]|nr:ribulose-phosphate 3-epimerase [Nitrospinota bacterium]
MAIIAPSILSADFARLGEEIKAVENAGADWLHLDIMDGHFVPNITVGPPVVASIRKVTKLTLDVHLMIENADAYIPEFAKAGADVITVHQEACRHLHRTIHLIKSLGKQAGVVINPATPVHTLKDIIADVDLVLIMSVNPGFGGQSFIPGALRKIAETRKLLKEHGSGAEVEVDGGVGRNNVRDIIQAGASVLVAGNAIFKSGDYTAAIKALKTLENI